MTSVPFIFPCKWGSDVMKIATILTVLMVGAGLPLVMPSLATARAETADTAAFEAFGGKDGIDKVVAEFVTLIFANPQIGPFFKDSSPERLRKTLAEQFCAELSGPCTYTGQSMKQVHARFNIRREHFNVLVEELQTAMAHHDVPFWAQGKLLARLAPMNRDIIGNADKVPGK